MQVFSMTLASCLIFPVLLQCLTRVTADSSTCTYTRVARAFINEAYANKVKSANDLECAHMCSCRERCVVSHNADSGQCWVAEFGFALIHLTGDAVLNTSASAASWFTYVLLDGASQLAPRPPALWLLDSVLNTNNVGSKGDSLQLSASGVSWNAVGPRGSSAQPTFFAELSASSRMSVPLQASNGRYIVHLTKAGFTWCLWLKTKLIGRVTPILGGGMKVAHLWFYPSTGMNQIILNLFLGGKPLNDYTTSVNSTDRDQWRHIAATYSEATDGKVYLNGHEWVTHGGKQTTTDVAVPDVMEIGMGNYGPDKYVLEGSMACVAMYERVLNATEIAAVMAACP